MTLLLGLLAAALAGTSTTPPPRARVAIVIGNNFPLPGHDYETLRFADDDAIRFADFFAALGVDTTLLTTPDAETAARFPAWSKRALRPVRAEVERVLARVRAESEGAEVFFVFSGHGSITGSDAYLHLFDERFTRVDLFERVLRGLRAERVHVIIDSCHSYFLVNARGERVAVAADEESLDRYRWAGFFLSTSERREVQEWSGYEAGVFSYQVLSALRGAADVDRDGVVTYDEAHAFVVAANHGIQREEARIHPFVRRPTDGSTVLLDLRGSPLARRAVVPETVAGHFSITAGALGRVLDANKPAGAALDLVVPDGELTLRLGGEAYALAQGASRFERTDTLELAQSKGPIADELRKNLFRVPLTPDFVLGIAAASPQITRVYEVKTPNDPWHRDPLTIGLLAAGGAALVTGAVGTTAFLGARDRANAPVVTPETEAARAEADTWRVVLTAGFAAGGALITAGVLRLLLTNAPDEGP